MAPILPIDSDDIALRHRLARGDGVMHSTGPILQHLLGNENNTLFSDDILANIRGMIADLARQTAQNNLQHPADDLQQCKLAELIILVPGLLGHLHALALEGQLAMRLQRQIGLDPVLSPLVQSLIASENGGIGATAMKLLAAQARFVQNIRHMLLPITELPADLLHGLLTGLRADACHFSDAVDSAIRAKYDESSTRLGLLSQLVTSMGAGHIAALNITHAGSALFATSLAFMGHRGGSVCARDSIMVAMEQLDSPRLALTLRAIGLKNDVIAENGQALGHDLDMLAGVLEMSLDHAGKYLRDPEEMGGIA